MGSRAVVSTLPRMLRIVILYGNIDQEEIIFGMLKNGVVYKIE